MNLNDSPESWLSEIIQSEKTKRAAGISLLAGMGLCMVLLILPLPAYASLPFAALIIFAFAFCCLYANKLSLFSVNTGLIITILCLALAAIGIFSYLRGWQWLESAHASEMVLARLLAQENTLLSANWRYSTELRLVNQTIFTMPLFKLLGRLENWALIRSMNIVLNNIVLILSYVFMMKQTRIHLKWILISCFFLILPLSYEYWNIVTFGGYYIFFMAKLFCCLGLFIKLCSNDDTIQSALPVFILFSMLSFVLGVHGIRALLAVHVPLLIAVIYLWSKMAPAKRLPLFLGCYAFVLCCFGYLVSYLLSLRFSVYSYDTMRSEYLANYLQKLGLSLMNIAGFFGLLADVPLLSAQGLFSLAAIAGAFILLWALYKLVRKEQGRQQFIPVFFAASLVFNIFVFVVTVSSITPRFFFPFMVLYIPLTALLFHHAEKAYGQLKRTAVVWGIILFLFGQGFLNFQSLAAKDINSIRKGHIQYLLDEGLEFGIAVFWNANVITELSNGKIDMAGLEHATGRAGANPFSIFGYLVQEKHYDPFHHLGESFLLLNRNEWDMYRHGQVFSGMQPDYQDEHFVVLRYESADVMYAEVMGM